MDWFLYDRDLIMKELKNCMFQKHLGLILNVKSQIQLEAIKNITQKISKTLCSFRRFQPILPFYSLNIKHFIRSQLDYADVIYDQGCNCSFHEKLEYLQYNACLAITVVVRWTSSEKIFHELGL